MLKRKLINEYKIFRSEATWAEFALWWLMRGLLIYALVTVGKQDRNPVIALQLKSEIVLSFIIPLMHLLPKRIFLSRIHYRTQNSVMIMIFLMAFMGQYMDYLNKYEWYDTYMHVVSSLVFVFICYRLTLSLQRGDKKISPMVGAICAFGLSFLFAIGWEIFEFICDFLFLDSNTQNWSFVHSDQLQALFPNIDPRRYPLLDTMVDLIADTIGSVIGGFLLYVYLLIKKRKQHVAAKKTVLPVQKSEKDKTPVKNA